MQLIMSTANLPEGEKFFFYRDIICDYYYQTEIQRKSDSPFDAELSEAHFGNLSLSVARAGGHSSSNINCKKPQSCKKSVFILQQLSGTAIFFQDDRTVTIGPNDIICFDNTRPLSCDADGTFEQLLLRVPYDLWDRRFGRSENVTAQVLNAGAGINPVLVNYFNHIQLVTDNLDFIAAGRLEEATLSMIAAAFSELVSKQGSGRQARRMALFYRAKMFIEKNLHDNRLNQKKIAAFLGISESNLKAIFHDENQSIGKCIWDMRLETCRRDIVDPLHSGKSLTEIAFNCGFNSFSHFSRKFKEKFNMTASECRKEHLNSGL